MGPYNPIELFYSFAILLIASLLNAQIFGEIPVELQVMTRRLVFLQDALD